MVNFALGRQLGVMGTWYHHKDVNKVTWRFPDNKICNQIDKIDHSFISLFSIYPYTGKTKNVEMVIIDVKVSVRMTDVK